jgi:flagellar protein FlaJ
VIYISSRLIKRIAKNMPGLSTKLIQSGIIETPEEFIKKTLLSTFYMTTGIGVLVLTIFAQLEILSNIMYFIFPLFYVFMFSYMLKIPDVKIMKKGREISKEIVFAGRFLIIELESGVSLYDAMENVSKNYKVIGNYFKEITDKVSLGTTMEDAINETIETTPSSNLTKVLWQILNSLRTGADISSSLSSILDHIVREQVIEVKEYGRKLNPLAMFYMMVAIIMPSLGITMLIVLTTFISIKIDLAALMSIAFFLGFVQYMFFSIIKSSRPAVEI